ncbi:unnamed protein product [Brassica oleracea var. botrytis]
MCLILTNRSLRSSLIVCSSALGRSTSLLQVHICLWLKMSMRCVREISTTLRSTLRSLKRT